MLLPALSESGYIRGLSGTGSLPGEPPRGLGWRHIPVPTNDRGESESGVGGSERGALLAGAAVRWLIVGAVVVALWLAYSLTAGSPARA